MLTNIARFNIYEGSSAIGASTFSSGGPYGGSVSTIHSNIKGLLPPTGSNGTDRGWFVPAGTYIVKGDIKLSGLANGHSWAIVNFGKNGTVSNKPTINMAYITINKTHIATDDIDGSFEMAFFLESDTYLYLSKFCEALDKPAPSHFSAGSQITFIKL